MSIYVDALIDYGVRYGRAGPEWCHMVADTEIELHAFAARLGLKRRWFQSSATHALPHYDLTRFMRAKAVRLGATEIDRRQMVAMVQAYRQGKAEASA